jgi:hypothetical protein
MEEDTFISRKRPSDTNLFVPYTAKGLIPTPLILGPKIPRVALNFRIKPPVQWSKSHMTLRL